MMVVLVIVTFIFTAFESSAATRRRRPRSPFSTLVSATYTDTTLSEEEGGVDGYTLGLDFGVALSPTSSFFLSASYQKEPFGFQDLRFGLSKIYLLNTAYTDAMSFSLSIPTSKFSQTVQTLTQGTLANTLIFRRGAFGMLTTLFVGKSFYSKRPNVLLSSELGPNPITGSVGQNPGTQPGGDGLDGDPLEGDLDYEDSGGGFSGNFAQNLVDEFYGGSLGLSYSLTPNVSIESSVSATNLAFSLTPPIWSTEISPLQITVIHKRLTTFASYSRFINSPVIEMPFTESYSVGTSYSL